MNYKFDYFLFNTMTQKSIQTLIINELLMIHVNLSSKNIKL